MKKQNQILSSLLFTLALAFGTYNFFLSRASQSDDREVASFADRNSNDQIKWEQSVAQKISQDEEIQKSVLKSTAPGWQDKLVYEFLHGKYDVEVKQGSVERLSLQQNQFGVKINTEQFLNDYGHQLKKFKKFEIKTVDSKNERIELFDQTGSSAGLINVIKDDQGRVLEIQLK